MPLASTGELSPRLMIATMGLEASNAIGTAVAPTAAVAATRWELAPLTKAVPEPAWPGYFGGNRVNLNVFQTGAKANIEYYAAAQNVGAVLAALFGAVTPTGTGPYVHTFAAPYRTTIPAATKRALTLYEANMDSANGYAYCVSGAWVQKLSLKSGSNLPVTFGAELIGKRYDPSTQDIADGTPFSLPAAESLFTGSGFSIARDSLDAVGGATTAWFPNAYTFELNIDTGRVQNQEMGFMEQVAVQPWLEGEWGGITASLTMARNPANKAVYDYLVGGSPAARRDVLAFTFTTGANILKIEMGGAIIETPKVERGGLNERMVVTWHGYTDVTLATPIKITLTNSQAAIT